MEHTFDTPTPIELYVELGSGTLAVTARETNRTQVTITGEHAQDVAVEHSGSQVSVIARRRTGFLGFGDSPLAVTVSVPTNSSLVTKTGSASQRATGAYATARLKSGSGEVWLDTVTGPAVLDTGSGDIAVREARGDLRSKSGSGQVRIGAVGGGASVSTGSGDITVAETHGATLTKSGSGNVQVRKATGDLNSSLGSGDLLVDLFTAGGLQAKAASGNVRIGVPAGIPVWTDVSAVSGRVASNLQGAGQPAPGQPHLELRITTVSGDITLTEH